MGHVPSILTLKLGRPWSPQPLPEGVPQGPERQCYENAGTLAIAHRDLLYVEGYAQPPGLPPIHHAWCVDTEGRVIDNTFRDPELSQYFGVPIRGDTLRNMVADTGRWGLFPEMMTPEILLRAVDEVQAGPCAVAPLEADAVRTLINQHA